MNKRKTKKEAYKLIFKENKSHQKAFDELRGSSELGHEDLASIVAGTPSRKQYQDKKAFWITLIVVFAILMVLRLLGVLALMSETNMPHFVIAFAITLGIFVPAIGVYAAINARLDWFRGIAFMLLYGIFKNLTRDDIEYNMSSYIVLSFFALAGFGAMYFPSLFKTKFKKSVTSIDVDGTIKKEVNYIFEETESVNDDELLDSH